MSSNQMDETKKRKKDRKKDKKSKRKKVKEKYDISSEDQLEPKVVEDVLKEANEDKGLLHISREPRYRNLKYFYQ